MDTIERDAKLFEAGEYPDRGIEITEEDLDRFAGTTADVPVRIEHTATPFDGAIGFLKSVYRKGRELFGKLAFNSEAWELIRAANAKRLSVAIRKDKSAIAEVSLVREPRIADAAVFSAEEVVSLDEVDLSLETSVAFADEDAVSEDKPSFSDGAGEPDPEVIRLQRELDEKQAESRIDELKRAGKLAPAAEVFARAILTAEDSSVITFADEERPISEVFLAFLDAQPKVIEFSELATASAGTDEPEIFARLGVTSEQVEKHRGR